MDRALEAEDAVPDIFYSNLVKRREMLADGTVTPRRSSKQVLAPEGECWGKPFPKQNPETFNEMDPA